MRFRVVTVLILSFGGLVLVSAMALLVLALQQAVENTQLALSFEVEKLLEEAEQESRLFYGLAEAEARWLTEAVEEGVIAPDDAQAMQLVLAGALSTQPQIEAVTYQLPDGAGFYYDRATGSITSVTWPRAWRVSDRGVRAGGVWVLRPSALDGSHRATFVSTARDGDGAPLGTFGIRIDPSLLSQRLSQDAEFRGFSLTRFLLFNDRVVLAHPNLADAGPNFRPTIDDVDDPYLMALATADRLTPRLVAPIENADIFFLGKPGLDDQVFAVRQDTYRQTGGRVTIGVHFERAAGDAEINRLYVSIAVGVALVVASLAVALWIGARAARPIRAFAEAARSVERGDLDGTPTLRPSRLIELNEAAHAFNGMVDGLRERAKIRDLFGKYVPENVAKMLISDEGASEPRQATATVFFLDIAGFSSMSEKMTPRQVIETMNAFFSRAVEIIEENKGVVTQFQGDAVVAVFNTPVEDPDHAYHAVKSAQTICEAARDERFAGEQLSCRIGVNTGPLVSGAVGASNRLSYTVHGDAVNVAARLEQMNKETETTILVSGTTAALVEEIPLRAIGSMPIRGREAPVALYTVDELVARAAE